MAKYKVKVEFWNAFNPDAVLWENAMSGHKTMHWRTYHVTAKNEAGARQAADDKALDDVSANMAHRYTVGDPENLH